MIWISSVTLGFVFGYISYISIHKLMIISAELNKHSNFIVRSLWDAFKVCFSVVIIFTPQFILIFIFKDPEHIPRLLPTIIMATFIFFGYRSVRKTNKKLYWELFKSQEQGITFSEKPIWESQSLSVTLNASISEYINIKCIVSQNTLHHSFPNEQEQSPIDIFNSHKYELLPIFQNRIAQGHYSENCTVIINKGEL